MNSQSSRLKNLEGGYKLIQKKVSRQEHRMQETEVSGKRKAVNFPSWRRIHIYVNHSIKIVKDFCNA